MDAMDASNPNLIFDHDSHVMPIRWNEALSSGNAVIDRQHRQLFDMGNQLVAAVRKRESRVIVEAMLLALIKHIEGHFITEEALLARQGHALTPQHQGAHDELLFRARELQARYHEGQAQAGDIVSFITYDVILSHIVKEDLKAIPKTDGDADAT